MKNQIYNSNILRLKTNKANVFINVCITLGKKTYFWLKHATIVFFLYISIDR